MSAKELNIGDYVRWCNGDIARITDIKKYKTKEDEYYFDRVLDWHEDRAENNNIVYEGLLDLKDFKSSPNIIDLIEVGDYANGELIIALRKDIKNERNIHFNSKDNLIFTDYNIAENWYYGIDTDKIKSIVTKEQFESMEYKIGGNK